MLMALPSQAGMWTIYHRSPLEVMGTKVAVVDGTVMPGKWGVYGLNGVWAGKVFYVGPELDDVMAWTYNELEDTLIGDGADMYSFKREDATHE